MANRPVRPSTRPQPAPSALPIQSYQLSKEQLQDPAVMNVMLQQIFTALNQGNGSLGKVVLPAGVDVNGSTISNVGTPQADSDAISSGHAQGNYSAPVIGPQLDVGGTNTLKGLTALYAQLSPISQLLATGISGTVVLAKITGGGSNGSITFTKGIVTGIVNPT